MQTIQLVFLLNKKLGRETVNPSYVQMCVTDWKNENRWKFQSADTLKYSFQANNGMYYYSFATAPTKKSGFSDRAQTCSIRPATLTSHMCAGCVQV